MSLSHLAVPKHNGKHDKSRAELITLRRIEESDDPDKLSQLARLLEENRHNEQLASRISSVISSVAFTESLKSKSIKELREMFKEERKEGGDVSRVLQIGVALSKKLVKENS